MLLIVLASSAISSWPFTATGRSWPSLLMSKSRTAVCRSSKGRVRLRPSSTPAAPTRLVASTIRPRSRSRRVAVDSTTSDRSIDTSRPIFPWERRRQEPIRSRPSLLRNPPSRAAAAWSRLRVRRGPAVRGSKRSARFLLASLPGSVVAPLSRPRRVRVSVFPWSWSVTSSVRAVRPRPRSWVFNRRRKFPASMVPATNPTVFSSAPRTGTARSVTSRLVVGSWARSASPPSGLAQVAVAVLSCWRRARLSPAAAGSLWEVGSRLEITTLPWESTRWRLSKGPSAPPGPWAERRASASTLAACSGFWFRSSSSRRVGDCATCSRARRLPSRKDSRSSRLASAIWPVCSR